jgi:hypothetical protein
MGIEMMGKWGDAKMGMGSCEYGEMLRWNNK